MLTGKIRASAGVDSKDGENGRIPLPFVVLISGKTAITRCGFFSKSARRVVKFLGDGGDSAGGERASRIPRKRETRWTLRVPGNEMVNIGSKMAAR